MINGANLTGENGGAYALAPDVLTRTVGHEVLLLNTTTEQYFSLNPVGADFLALVEDGLTVAAAVESLSGTYDAPLEKIAVDIAALARTLEERGLIVPAD